MSAVEKLVFAGHLLDRSKLPSWVKADVRVDDSTKSVEVMLFSWYEGTHYGNSVLLRMEESDYQSLAAIEGALRILHDRLQKAGAPVPMECLLQPPVDARDYWRDRE